MEISLTRNVSQYTILLIKKMKKIVHLLTLNFTLVSNYILLYIYDVITLKNHIFYNFLLVYNVLFFTLTM